MDDLFPCYQCSNYLTAWLGLGGCRLCRTLGTPGWLTRDGRYGTTLINGCAFTPTDGCSKCYCLGTIEDKIPVPKVDAKLWPTLTNMPCPACTQDYIEIRNLAKAWVVEMQCQNGERLRVWNRIFMLCPAKPLP